MVSNLITHNIDQSTYAKLGEILLRWAEAEGFLGNSINWVSGYSPDSADADKVYKLSMIEKIKLLEKWRGNLQNASTSNVDDLICDIRQAMDWKKVERDPIAHGTALQSSDGTVLLRTDKGYEFRIDDVDEALTHARSISNLAVQLNLRFAAPWTKSLFPAPERLS